MLICEQYLKDEQDRLSSLGHVTHAAIYNEALALVEYLAPHGPEKVSCDVLAALTTYDSLLREMSDRGMSSTQDYEATLIHGKVRLLYHHSRTSKIFRRALLRETLEAAINNMIKCGKYVNTLLWTLYAWNESRNRMEGRVSDWLRDKINGLGTHGCTVPGWCFTIWTELRTCGAGYDNAVRALFEEAVECKSTQASIFLWALYVEFELREKNPGRAKVVLFRAMQNCPWSKGKRQ